MTSSIINLNNLNSLSAINQIDVAKAFGAIGSNISESFWGEPGNPYLGSSNENVKKYQVIEVTEDILALSVTWQRLRASCINIINRPTNLTDKILFNEMIQEDRDRANIIRDYFSKKLMMISLRGQPLSNFRKDLNTFIHGSTKIVKEEMMPLIYRLPEFYDNDIEHDEMFKDLNRQFENTHGSVLWQDTKTLFPVNKFLIKAKGKKFIEYWLKDSDDKGYRIEILCENKLNHLWEYFFKQESITIVGTYKYSEHDAINYYQVNNWQIDFSET